MVWRKKILNFSDVLVVLRRFSEVSEGSEHVWNGFRTFSKAFRKNKPENDVH